MSDESLLFLLWSFPLLITKVAKKSREEEQAKRDANDRSISDYFTKGAGKAQPKPKVWHIHPTYLLYNPQIT